MVMRSRQAINAETLEQASQEVDYPLPPQTVRRRILYCLFWLTALCAFDSYGHHGLPGRRLFHQHAEEEGMAS
jgi:hypothetical protein